MTSSVFEDKIIMSDDKMPAGALGKSNQLWQWIKKASKGRVRRIDQ